MWEIWSQGRLPYPGMTNQVVIAQVLDGHRMTPPDADCPVAVYETMLSCWHADYNQRLTFTALKASLARLLRDLDAPQLGMKNFPLRRSSQLSRQSSTPNSSSGVCDSGALWSTLLEEENDPSSESGNKSSDSADNTSLEPPAPQRSTDMHGPHRIDPIRLDPALPAGFLHDGSTGPAYVQLIGDVGTPTIAALQSGGFFNAGTNTLVNSIAEITPDMHMRGNAAASVSDDATKRADTSASSTPQERPSQASLSAAYGGPSQPLGPPTAVDNPIRSASVQDMAPAAPHEKERVHLRIDFEAGCQSIGISEV